MKRAQCSPLYESPKKLHLLLALGLLSLANTDHMTDPSLQVDIRYHNNINNSDIHVYKTIFHIFHDLLIARLESYGFGVGMGKSYLGKRRHRVRVEDIISGESRVGYGVPQGSILGTLYYIIYVKKPE